MTRKSQGSVRLRKGKYEARITIHGQLYEKRFGDQQAAWDFLNALLQLHKERAKAPVTLASVGKSWLDHRETCGLYGHVDKERSVWRRHVHPWPEAHRPLKTLRRKHLAELFDELAKKKAVKALRYRDGQRGSQPLYRIELTETDRVLSRRASLHVLRLIRGCLDHAVDRGLIKDNPSTGFKVPRRKTTAVANVWTFLTLDEIETVLALEHGDLTTERHAIYATAIYTGLRKSELWRLTWNHVHLKGRRPRVEVRGEAKSETSVRDVPLLPPAIDALRRWRKAGKAPSLRGVVFPRAEDGGKHSNTFDAAWADKPYRDDDGVLRVQQGTRSRAGIERPVRFHDLRHTFCSHLVQGSWGQAWDLYTVCKVAGHADIGVTQRYAHLSPEGVFGAAERMRENWATKGSEGK